MLRRRTILGFLLLLALLVAAGLFLARNWSLVGGNGLTGATLVAGTAPLPAVRAKGLTAAGTGSRTAGAAAGAGSGSGTAAAAGAGSGYFAAAHLRRAQAESRELAELQQLAANTAATATVRAEAQQQILQLQQQQEEEVTAELVLQAKGYPQSLVMLAPAGATVVVGASGFTAADAARVGQAVAQVAGMDPAQVQIVARPAA